MSERSRAEAGEQVGNRRRGAAAGRPSRAHTESGEVVLVHGAFAGADDVAEPPAVAPGGSEPDRWRSLIDATVGMAHLQLDALLARLVEVAATLVDARYAALGVVAEGGGPRRISRFVTCGMDASVAQEIGDLPDGRGILGRLIDLPEPLRLDDLTQHPASSGFPPGHPPMRSFLGVPIRVHDRVFGNLYLAEKRGGPFTDQDQSLVTALAASAGAAIENARQLEAAARRERWLYASVDLTRMLLQPLEGVDPLRVVADRVRTLAGADVAWVVEVDNEGLCVRVVSGLEVGADELAGLDLGRSLAAEVVRTGAPIDVQDVTSDPRAADLGRLLGWEPLGRAVLVPLRGVEAVEGVVALAWWRTSDPVPDTDPALPALFADQAMLAMRVARAREEQERLAVSEDRDRIARDLHDLVIQRLFAIGLSLQGTARLSDQGEVSERLNRAVQDIDDRIRELRQTIFALSRPGSSDDVRLAVADVVARAWAVLKFRPEVRFVGPVGSLVVGGVADDVIAVLTEALSNVARHGRASTCEVELSAVDGVRLTVSDDGAGIPTDVVEGGLGNMRRRAEARGGHLEVRAREPRGTVLVWQVPFD
jgi:signal transduction histidine kinase